MLKQLLYFGVSPFYVPDRVKFARLFYGGVIAFIIYRFFNHLLFSQLQAPELVYVSTDITYITFAFAGITRFLTHNTWAAALFDTCFISMALVCFVFPRRVWPSVLFTILLGVYIVVGYTYLCFHKHNLTGMWFASLIFLAPDAKGFTLLFKLIRYYCLLVYASAGFWKFYRNVWDMPGHLGVILKNDALPYLSEHPSWWLANHIYWLIAHPGLLDKLMIITCLAQVLYVVGLFTRRLDGWFLIFALVFHLFSLLFLRAWFFEFSLILITLLPVKYFYKPAIK